MTKWVCEYDDDCAFERVCAETETYDEANVKFRDYITNKYTYVNRLRFVNHTSIFNPDTIDRI